MTPPPIVCVIGRKNSGKTTLAVALMAELRRRGFRVMSVKHGHGFDLDRSGTDSWRHADEGGAERVVMASPAGMAVIGSWGTDGEPPLAHIVERYLADADVVVAEGFKHEAHPTIEVFRRALHAEPLYDRSIQADRRYLAMVSDSAVDAPFPVLLDDDPDRAARLADLVVRRLIGEREPRTPG